MISKYVDFPIDDVSDCSIHVYVNARERLHRVRSTVEA